MHELAYKKKRKRKKKHAWIRVILPLSDKKAFFSTHPIFKKKSVKSVDSKMHLPLDSP